LLTQKDVAAVVKSITSSIIQMDIVKGRVGYTVTIVTKETTVKFTTFALNVWNILNLWFDQVDLDHLLETKEKSRKE
jgi:hypothetical protein